jgi:hypothetical protein
MEPNRIGTRQFQIEKTAWKYISDIDGYHKWSRNLPTIPEHMSSPLERKTEQFSETTV